MRRRSKNNIFQSTLPTRGSDFAFRPYLYTRGDFNPRSPRGGATHSVPFVHDGCRVISIHAPHEGERPCRGKNILYLSGISIHAPHEGERHNGEGAPIMRKAISIHAPHEGERLRFTSTLLVHHFIFQSTLPTRGSDNAAPQASGRARYFNPRSPRGGATLR